MERVLCPLCQLNISLFNLRQRDEHVNKCLDHPGTPLPEKASFGDDLKVEAETCQTYKTSPSQQGPEKPDPLVKEENKGGLREGPVKREVCTPAPALKRSGSQTKFLTGQEPAREPAKRPRPQRQAPFFKILTFGKVRLGVDAFMYGDLKVDGYFLTHFHSDHYGGLSKKWAHGQIYCTPATARLVAMKLRVGEEFLEHIEVGKEYMIHEQKVRVLDANHCPGAALFLFNNSVLHTGDFRASDEVLANVLEYTDRLSTLYLDTTYLDPGRTFPSQRVVIETCSELCRQEQSKGARTSFFSATRKTRVLVLVGTYTIGKERLAVEIARRLGTKIWASAPEKRRVLAQLGDAELEGLLERENGLECQVHLVNMRDLAVQKLEQQWVHLRKHYTEMLAFSPTGWTHTNRTAFSLESVKQSAVKRPEIRVFRVPYSEHSSFSELERFCRGVSCGRIIPTVSTKNKDILAQWEQP